MNNKLFESIDNFLWNKYNEVKNKDNKSQEDSFFYLNFWSWDKGDCSNFSLLTLMQLYMYLYTQDDYEREYFSSCFQDTNFEKMIERFEKEKEVICH